MILRFKPHPPLWKFQLSLRLCFFLLNLLPPLEFPTMFSGTAQLRSERTALICVSTSIQFCIMLLNGGMANSLNNWSNKFSQVFRYLVPGLRSITHSTSLFSQPDLLHTVRFITWDHKGSPIAWHVTFSGSFHAAHHWNEWCKNNRLARRNRTKDRNTQVNSHT